MGQPIWTGSGYDYSLPDTISADQIGQFWRSASGDGQSYDSAAAAGAGAIPYYGFNDPSLAKFAPNSHNYMAKFNTDGTLAGIQVKSGDKEGTFVPYKMDASGNYVPNYAGAAVVPWDTNAGGESIAAAAAVVLGGLGAGFGAAALGMEGASMAGMSEALGAGAGAGTAAGAAGTGTLPAAQVSGTELGLLGSPSAYAAPATGATGGLLGPSAAGVTGSDLAMYGAPAVGGASGLSGGASAPYSVTAPTLSPYDASGALNTAGTTSGSLPFGMTPQQMQSVGGLLGAGLGYLDAAGQPTSMTTTNMPDPYSLATAYGPGGTLSAVQNSYAQSQANPNYMAQAGQQISALGQQTPESWNSLVSNNQALWDSNPWVQEQQKAITDLATQNMLQTVMPNIGSQANAAGGYGGSRQGIAQGLAIGQLNQNLAPALTGLASNAWESSQNRAMQGAQYQGQYGLAAPQMQAGLLAQGANMQMGAPWYNSGQYVNQVSHLPGGTSSTTPLFNNPTAGAIGGAQYGSNNVLGIYNGLQGLFNW